MVVNGIECYFCSFSPCRTLYVRKLCTSSGSFHSYFTENGRRHKIPLLLLIPAERYHRDNFDIKANIISAGPSCDNHGTGRITRSQ